MPHFELDAVEARVLGCLLEKERTTPENYPISLNALTNACNQTTAREPVTAFSEREVDNAITRLRQEKLATMIHSAGARVQKYRHNLPDHYELKPKEVALLCVLLLRGAQTAGELRQRTERLQPFNTLEEVEATLNGLALGSDPLVRQLPARPGQKERRYVQIFTGEPSEEVLNAPASGTGAEAGPGRSQRLDALEKEVTDLRGELQALREQFEIFRRQFE